MKQDIRWIQRLENYTKALAKLTNAISLYINSTDLDDALLDLIKEGLIQRFEYTHELAWNVMKDYEVYQGDTEIRGSRDAIRQALAIGIIDDRTWLTTIEARNTTSHNYDEDAASSVVERIITKYYPLFVSFADKMNDIKEKDTYEG